MLRHATLDRYGLAEHTDVVVDSVAGLQGVDHGPSGLDDDVGAGCRIARADWEPDPVTVGRCPLHAALSLGFGRM